MPHLSTRRTVLSRAAALAGLAATTSVWAPSAWAGAPLVGATHQPKEGDPHAATWMAFGATVSAWGDKGAFGASRHVARHDLIRIAANLSRYERVHMLVANAADHKVATALLKTVVAGKHPSDQQYTDEQPQSGREPRMIASGPLAPMRPDHIEFIVQPINDLWMRDIGPVFVRDSKGTPGAVDFNFNGWGQERLSTPLRGWRKDPNKSLNGVQYQDVSADRRVAKFITKRLGLPRVETWLTMEGGGVEVNGRGLATVALSCIINDNRNPGKTQADVEAELRRVLGVERVFWIPGIRATEITDGHVDFYARFVSDNEIVYNWDGGEDEHGRASVDAKNLRHLRNAQGVARKFTPADRKRLLGSDSAELIVTPLHTPDPDRVADSVTWRTPDLAPEGYYQDESFAAGYVGFYEANGCILMSHFGDPAADRAAYDLIRNRYPDRVVMQFSCDGLANGGGTIHCATQQQPA